MDDFILYQTNLMRKIRLSYESFKTLGEGAPLDIFKSCSAALKKNWEKFEKNDEELQSIKQPDASRREYFISNLFEWQKTLLLM